MLQNVSTQIDKDTSESRALILEGREFQAWPSVEYSIEFSSMSTQVQFIPLRDPHVQIPLTSDRGVSELVTEIIIPYFFDQTPRLLIFFSGFVLVWLLFEGGVYFVNWEAADSTRTTAEISYQRNKLHAGGMIGAGSSTHSKLLQNKALGFTLFFPALLRT